MSISSVILKRLVKRNDRSEHEDYEADSKPEEENNEATSEASGPTTTTLSNLEKGKEIINSGKEIIAQVSDKLHGKLINQRKNYDTKLTHITNPLPKR